MIQSAEASKDSSIQALAENFCKTVPHNLDLGLEIISTKDQTGHLRLIPKPELVGELKTGHIFNSVLLSMADACAGLTSYLNLNQPLPIATLDLRMDYLYPAPGDRPLHCIGTCLRKTKDIIFIRCTISAEGSKDIIAIGNAVFMQGRSKIKFAPITAQGQ